MLLRGGLAAALFLEFATASRPAAAASPIELRWSAPRECPDDLGLARAIEDVLGERPDKVAEQPLSIDAHVHGDSVHGYAAKVRFDSAQGKTERELEHPECGKLTEGVALLIALAIDPERVRARQEVTPPAQASATPTPTPPPVQAVPAPERAAPEPRALARDAPVTAPSTPRAFPLRGHIAVLGVVGTGMLPGTAPGLGADAALRWGRFEAALSGRFWATRSAAIPTTTDASVDLSLMTAGLRLCGLPSHRRWSSPACLRADVGRLSGQGQRVDNARGRHDTFAALGGSLGLAYDLGRVSPLVGAELLKITERPRFGALAEGQDLQAFRPRSWQFSAFIGLAYAL